VRRASRSILALLGFGAPVAFSGAGCSQCMALCLSSVSAVGHLDVGVEDQVPLAVEMCVEGTCETHAILYGDSNAYCESALFCSLKPEAGGSRLEVSVMPSIEVEVGLVVTVRVERTDTSEVLVDVERTLTVVSTNELCGNTCHAGSVTWDPLP